MVKLLENALSFYCEHFSSFSVQQDRREESWWSRAEAERAGVAGAIWRHAGRPAHCPESTPPSGSACRGHELWKTSRLSATNQAKRQWGSIGKCHLKGLKKSHLITWFTASSLTCIHWSNKIKREQFSKIHLLHENSLGVVCENSSSQMMASGTLGNHVNTGW